MTELAVDPSAFFGYEVLGSWLGAVGGGVGGFLLGFFICMAGMDTNSDAYAGLACLIGGGGIGYLVGTPLGAMSGAAVVGGMNHVRGNLLLSTLGGVAGEGAGVFGIGVLAGVGLDSDLGGVAYLAGVPLFSALGATWGYNVGATIVPAAAN